MVSDLDLMPISGSWARYFAAGDTNVDTAGEFRAAPIGRRLGRRVRQGSKIPGLRRAKRIRQQYQCWVQAMYDGARWTRIGAFRSRPSAATLEASSRLAIEPSPTSGRTDGDRTGQRRGIPARGLFGGDRDPRAVGRPGRVCAREQRGVFPLVRVGADRLFPADRPDVRDGRAATGDDPRRDVMRLPAGRRLPGYRPRGHPARPGSAAAASAWNIGSSATSRRRSRPRGPRRRCSTTTRPAARIRCPTRSARPSRSSRGGHFEGASAGFSLGGGTMTCGNSSDRACRFRSARSLSSRPCRLSSCLGQLLVQSRRRTRASPGWGGPSPSSTIE